MSSTHTALNFIKSIEVPVEPPSPTEPGEVNASENQAVEIIDFGRAPFTNIWHLQQDLVTQRSAKQIPDTILIGEHDPVITVGRGKWEKPTLNAEGGDPEKLPPLIQIERGGGVTWHGPGQLIAYPIYLLPPEKRDLHAFLRDLEEAIIHVLAAFDLTGIRNPGFTGVWVRTMTPSGVELKKIASIGVAVKQWVTYHGLSLNISNDPNAFANISPCGLKPRVMTSLSTATSTDISIAEVKPILLKALQVQLNGISL